MNFILKFGKFKGQQFSTTPDWYQAWLQKQDWFKMPTQLTKLQQAEKNLSQLSNKLKGWDGYSRKGYATESRLFEAEKAYEDLIYCDCGHHKDPEEKDCGCGGVWAI
jgi:uncharacterized protein (DUF3820 family)